MVKEIFQTLQGEGYHSGRAAVLCRFTGCNLWTGRERDRQTATCRFCDTDFVGTDGPSGGRYASSAALADAIVTLWPTATTAAPYVVLTGGEPLLQTDVALIEALHDRGAIVAVETNGTRPVPPGLDWVCVSPKAGTRLIASTGDELKVVFPQSGLDLETLAKLDFRHRFLQPMDGDNLSAHTLAAADYCMKNPGWRLSLQTHKTIGIP